MAWFRTWKRPTTCGHRYLSNMRDLVTSQLRVRCDECGRQLFTLNALAFSSANAMADEAGRCVRDAQASDRPRKARLRRRSTRIE